MTTHSYDTTIELSINGNSCLRDVTVYYEYEPAGGDGWNEPRYSESATVTKVEAEYVPRGMKAQWIDLLPMLTKECISALEADCCQHEQEEREFRKSEAAEERREAQWEVM